MVLYRSELINILDEYKIGLLSKATNGTIDDKYYMQTRNILMENLKNRNQIPKFIKNCRTADEFRRYMQTESDNYAVRRQIITTSLNSLIEYTEENFEEEEDPFSQIKQYRKVEQIGHGGSYIDPLLQENPRLRDLRSDIYSVGAIWYWLLCGRAPQGSDMRIYLENAAPNLLHKEIDIVMKCLSGNLEDRYKDCVELLDNINSLNYD